MWLIKFLFKILFVLIIISIHISAVVASEVLLTEDFNDGYAQEFGNEIGNWEVRFVDGNNGIYAATNDVFRFSLAGEQHWEDYTLEADFLNAQDGGLLIRASDQDNGIVLVIRPTNNDIYWHIRKGGNWGEVLGKSSLGHEPGEDLNVKIEAEGSEFRAYINGELKTSLTTTQFQNGKIGIYLFQQPKQYWDNVVAYKESEKGNFEIDSTHIVSDVLLIDDLNDGYDKDNGVYAQEFDDKMEYVDPGVILIDGFDDAYAQEFSYEVVNVASEILLTEDFDDGYAQEFGNEIGNWGVLFVDGNNGIYTATNDVFRFSLAGEQYWDDYILEADFLNAQDGGLLIRASDQDNGIALIVRPTNNDIYWHIRKGGNWGEVLSRSSLDHGPGEDLDVKIKAEGSEFKAYINGDLKTSFTTTEFQNGKIGIYLFQQPEQYWDNVMVYSFTDLPMVKLPDVDAGIELVDIEFVDIGGIIWTNLGKSNVTYQELCSVVDIFIYLTVNSEPKGAQIWVDGEFSGELTPNEMRFEPGNYKIELVKEGYQTHQFYCSDNKEIPPIILIPEQDPIPSNADSSSDTDSPSDTDPMHSTSGQSPSIIDSTPPIIDPTPTSTPGFYALFSLSVIFLIYFLMTKNRK
ncbi:MAG: PEGA domain-containing protein [Methanosarcinaceae archaeon]|nr:PEGA domain-containing protein [Methanosarcinaceae archaeon]